RNFAHRLIEEFMLAANRAVDGYLLKRGIPSLHRVHERPDGKKVLEFEELARAFGYSLGVEGLHTREVAVRHGSIPAPARGGRPDSRGHGRDRPMRVTLPGAGELNITPKHYQRLLKKIAGKPEERIVSYLMLRSLKQARYSAEKEGHFALAAASYTHFTSPIRRYPDLMVHRILGASLDGKHQIVAPERLQVIADDCSETERRAAEAERELVEWKKAKFMENRVGEQFRALIISTTRFGFFVELENLFIEGLVPIDTLPGDHYSYHENTRKIIGQRTRRQFSIGDAVEVLLDRVDPIESKLQFSLVEPERARKKSRKRT
ncbi:MAG TPA: RNB domain-containing ribonuclease, partial [Bryobacteraceae bacterium]|nr:RNB domain-containing ribonuclease [Bryobacteraceae bacterium]